MTYIMQSSDIANKIEKQLPELIVQIAKQYDIKPFIENPNFAEPRLVKWHQFGLLEHTQKVREAYLTKIDTKTDAFLENLGITKIIDTHFNDKISGLKKYELLDISIPLHDLGKIIAYSDSRNNREHELLSVLLMEEDILKNFLNKMGLLNEHLRYIKSCVGLHDILGKKLRDELKHAGKLKPEFLFSDETKSLCKKIANDYSEFKYEIGIYFLCDSLGKTDILIPHGDNPAVYEKKIISELERKKLPADLKWGVMQLPINLKLTESYFRTLTENH